MPRSKSTKNTNPRKMYPCITCGERFNIDNMFLDLRTLETTCDACERAVQGPSIDAPVEEHLEFALKRESERLIRQVAKLRQVETELTDAKMRQAAAKAEVTQLRLALSDAENRARKTSCAMVCDLRTPCGEVRR